MGHEMLMQAARETEGKDEVMSEAHRYGVRWADVSIGS
jgi:hypothetical protein